MTTVDGRPAVPAPAPGRPDASGTSPASSDATPGATAGAGAAPEGRRAGRLRGSLSRTGALVALVVLLAVLVVVSLAVGARHVPLADVLRTFTSPGTTWADVVVREMRVPRAALGIVVGAALGASGILMRSVTRNPLADPGLLGVSAGASLAVVIAVTVGQAGVRGQAWAALVGAGVVSAVVAALAQRRTTSPGRLVLAGVAVSAAVTSLVQAISLADARAFDELRFWAAGSLENRGTEVLAVAAPIVGVGLVLALACARPLAALALGDDQARALGTHPGRTRAATLVAVALLAGAATAAAGPVLFLGLLVAQAARALLGSDERWTLPAAILLGPSVLLAADVAGRVVAPPAEVAAGIMTALVGGPLLVAVVVRAKVVA